MVTHALPFAEETGTMHMALKTRSWTRRDLDRLPDDGNRYEVVRGALFVTPAPGPRHQQIVAELADRIAPYVATHGIGQLHFPRTVVVIGGSQVEPDLMVRRRVPPPPPSWEEAPLPFLVVEVLSETTRRRDLVAKRLLYMEAGIEEYWMLDGERRTITVARAGHLDIALADTLRWHPSRATAPLDIDVSTLFREALG